MIGILSAQFALLAFSATIAVGLYVGNGPETILTRALLSMVAAVFVSQFAAWTTKQVLRDYLRTRKMMIDREHLRAQEVAQGPDVLSPDSPVTE